MVLLYQLDVTTDITDIMLPFELRTPTEIGKALARRVKRHRLERGWTQEEVVQRSGMAIDTYRKFERTGQISLARLIRLATIFDALGGIEHLFPESPANSIAELEEKELKATRKRGKRADA